VALSNVQSLLAMLMNYQTEKKYQFDSSKKRNNEGTNGGKTMVSVLSRGI
jgi:hypothetical protein